jgi:nicotinamide-nucleotide amidase
MLPGVPLEMRMLLENEVVPRLIGRAAGAGVIRSRTVRVTAIPESTLAERLGDIDDLIAPLSLAYLPGLDGVDLRVTAWGLAPGDADARLAAAATVLRERAGAHLYAEGDTTLAEVVLAEARRRGLTIAAAESCTGGLFSARLTDVPGSSDVFLGGVVTYADAAKSELAGVEPAAIAEHGAVSEPVARAMALGVAQRLGADLAVGITGIAGPTGGSAEKPVGTVWLAVYDRGETVAWRVQLFNTRAEIRARAVQTTLYRLWQRIIGGA